jgi:hypothetical protein
MYREQGISGHGLSTQMKSLGLSEFHVRKPNGDRP